MAERTRPPSSEIEALKKDIQLPGSKPYARLCAYGRNGSGKTRLGASFPNVLIVDCNDEGDRSVKGVPGTRVIHCTNWHRVGVAYWYLKTARHPFESVSIDTVTEMNNLAMDFVLDEAENRDPTREKAMPDRRAYGRTATLMRGMLYAYRNLPLHVIFLAQERIIRDPDTEEILEITVDLPNGSRGAAMSGAGILGRLTPKRVRVREDGRVVKRWQDQLFVEPDEIVWTKDRTNLLRPVLKDPTGDKIIAAWNSGKSTRRRSTRNAEAQR